MLATQSIIDTSLRPDLPIYVRASHSESELRPSHAQPEMGFLLDRVTSFLDEGHRPSIGCRPAHIEIYLDKGNYPIRGGCILCISKS